MEPPCFHGKSGLWACLSVVPLCVGLGSGHPAARPAAEAAPGSDACSAAGPGLLLGCALVRSRAGLQTLGCLILKQVRLPLCQAVCCLGSPSQGGEVRVAGAIFLPLWIGGLPREPHGIPSSFPSNGHALEGWVGRWLEGPSEGQSYRRGTEQCLPHITHLAWSVLTLQGFLGPLPCSRGRELKNSSHLHLIAALPGLS